MHLARRYRLKFAAQRSDRLALCLAAAVTAHMGLMALGFKAWQAQTSQVAPESTQPIEFVYLDLENSESSETGPTSNINAQAGGNNQPGLLIAAGKPEELKPSQVAQNKPLTPNQPGTYVPTYSHADGDKEVEPESVEKTSTRAVPRATQPTPPGEAISPARDLQHDTPAVTLPSPVAKPEDPIPESFSQNSVSPSAQPTTTHEATDTGAASAGFGLNGLFNPDRTAINRPNIDAQRDEVWGEYTAVLNQSIYEHWQQINPDRTRETVVRFEVDRQGQLIHLEVRQSSGLAIADQTAIGAIEAAAPFAPFPANTTEASKVINFTFTHQVRSPR